MTARASIVLCLLLLLCGCVSRDELLPPPAQSVYAPPPTAWTALPVSRAATNRTLTAVWDYSEPVDGFRYYTNGVLAGTSPSNSFRFIAPAGRFTNQVSAYRAGVESAPSVPLVWPPILTNYVHIASVWVTNLTQQVGVTNWSITLTNPAGSRFYRHEIRGEVR